MEFGLSEEQVLLVDTVQKYLDTSAPLSRVRDFALKPSDQDIWQGLIDIGIGGLLVSEAQGGVGLGFVEAALISELLGSHVTPSPFFGTAVVLPSVLNRVDPDSSLLAGITGGTVRCGVGLAEANGARNGAAIVNRGGKLTGKTLFVIDPMANVFLVADAQRCLYLVEAGATGTSTRPLTNIDVTRPVIELNLSNTPARQLSSSPEDLHWTSRA
jgi:alkylation response protein AidB-like acyl-CoA dehydrogenase